MRILEGSFPPQASQALASQVYAERPDAANLVSEDRSSLGNGCRVAPQKKKERPSLPSPSPQLKKMGQFQKVITFRGGGELTGSIPTSIPHCHCPTCTSMAGQTSLTMANPAAQAHLRSGRPPPSSCFLLVGSSGGLVSSSRSLLQSLTPPPLS